MNLSTPNGTANPWDAYPLVLRDHRCGSSIYGDYLREDIFRLANSSPALSTIGYGMAGVFVSIAVGALAYLIAKCAGWIIAGFLRD